MQHIKTKPVTRANDQNINEEKTEMNMKLKIGSGYLHVENIQKF